MLPAASSASAPAAASAASALPGLGQTALSLVLVLVVIFALAALLKRVQGVRAGGSGSLRIHSGLQVGAKERVLLIEAGGQHLLIGVSAAGVQTLHVYAQAPADASPSPTATPTTPPPLAQAFSEALKRALGQTASRDVPKP